VAEADLHTVGAGGAKQVLLELVAEHDRREVAQRRQEPAELDGAEDPTVAALGGDHRAGLQVGPEALQQPQGLQHPLAVVVQHDAPADPLEVLGLLEDGHLQAQPSRRQGRGEPGRPGPHDGDPGQHQRSIEPFAHRAGQLGVTGVDGRMGLQLHHVRLLIGDWAVANP
jgi:hypothetical protein